MALLTASMDSVVLLNVREIVVGIIGGRFIVVTAVSGSSSTSAAERMRSWRSNTDTRLDGLWWMA